MPVQNQYMSEKVRFYSEFLLCDAYVCVQVEKTSFASSSAIKDEMRQMEEMFAFAFCGYTFYLFRDLSLNKSIGPTLSEP